MKRANCFANLLSYAVELLHMEKILSYEEKCNDLCSGIVFSNLSSSLAFLKPVSFLGASCTEERFCRTLCCEKRYINVRIQYNTVKSPNWHEQILCCYLYWCLSMEPSSGSSWLSGKFGALCPEGLMFEFHSRRHVGTLGKSFTYSCLLRFSVFTLTQYQCCSQECLCVVVDLKRRYRKIQTE